MNPVNRIDKIGYLEIARSLRDELANGRYGSEGRMPSEAQLVARFHVSRPTIARALRVLQDDGLVERRAGAGTFVKQQGASTGARSQKLLGLMMPDLGNTEIFQMIGGEIASLARVNDFTLVWDGVARLHESPELSKKHAEDLCQQFIERQASGVFFVPCELVPEKENVNRKIAVRLREAGIAVILIDRDVSGFPIRSDFDLVGVDNLLGSYLLTEHLLKLGCEKIHYVSRPYSAPTIEARIAGYMEALRRRNIRPDPVWIRTGDITEKRFARGLIGAQMPDAFMCANDHTAALLLRVLHQAGIRVPEQVRVVGFDDVNFATLVTPALTTIHQPCREMAGIAFRAMRDRLSDPSLPARSLIAAPNLVIRDSCGAYRAA